MTQAIIIMAKVPRAGKVKTRLQTILSPAQCAGLAECFFLDTFEKLKNLQRHLIIAFTPERSFFEKFAAPETLFVEQTGSDLGEKMFNAFDFAFRRNSDASVVMLGTDSPTVPAKYVEKAFENLKTADAVLGETADGGFYLIGLRRLKPEIFAGVDWSSEKTFRQTKENIARANLSLKELPLFYDVDTPADLETLRANFAQSEISRAAAPRTFQWLQNSEK